ncbi:enoyl-CoA hydratase/isomerase family protein [Cryptosporangium minutisporangium]|uniref:Enoyl-CoA hydratase/isomerase family protein n=1 Tax=Cryptosporangium minutisporangium TaxID=113569 RepID=A0ABP6SQY4_9ACTN
MPQLRRDRQGVLTVVVGPLGRFGDTTVRTLEKLARIGADLTGDVRVVVLELAGSSSQSDPSTTGSVSARLASLSDEERDSVLASYQAAVGWLRRADVVSVATARGPLAGVAVELALCCDLRLVATDASFALTGGRSEAAPVLGTTGRLVDLVGAGRATELCLTGRRVGAAEAERLGLASRAVPEAELTAVTDAFVADLLSADRAALAETKALLAGAPQRTPCEQAAAERESFARRLDDRYATTD